MIVEYIRYRIPEQDRRTAFEQAYATAAAQLDLAPQCLAYELSHGVEEPERYVLRIEWTSVADHEQGFRGGPYFPPFLAAVRGWIGDIEEMKHYAHTAVVSPAPRRATLHEAVGGTDALRRLSNTFYDGVLADPLLAPVFADFTRTHIEHVAVWLAEVFGGPEDFTADHGGHQALLRAHLGRSITEEQRVRWMELMADAVADELPDDAELRRRVLEYFDWGTRIARDVSADPVGTDLGEPGPTPRWGWNGLA
ncbi:antibiotic biosynthesis monooxygenase [Streptomyces avicenniae]|uniref:globin domain-containing protein n=1 Tax=Streptomyces avicenniae TaxID=500153 RepID=UPI000AC1364D|nr:antibiotic biosynthesis monooxygenase [Streptomyces avicenniae]